MDEKNQLLLGIDLGKQASQITCFDRTEYEAVPLGREINGEMVYEFPMALKWLKASGTWRFPDQEGDGGEEIILDHLLERFQKTSFEAGGHTFQTEMVLERYLLKLLSAVTQQFPEQRIKHLVITVHDKTPELTKLLHQVGKKLNLYPERMSIQNYRLSYMYYAVSQPKELWLNNVGLFLFNKEELLYSQITVDRRTIPWIVGVTTQNLTNVFYFITEMCSDYRGALPLQFYIDSLPEEHPAKILLAATKVAAMRTRSSFYVSAIMTLKLLTIPAINQMSNKSDFDIGKMIDEGKKIIIYLCLPARDKTYFPLASLVLRQLSDLIDYAADEKYGGRVPVRWNFVDDELGNFTKITNMRQQTSFGTGKGIRHFMFIQSYAQLDDVYGEKVSQIIQDNADIKIYLRSPNPTTKKKISEDLGNYTTRSYSKSNNTPSGTFRNGGSDGESSNLMGRPLLYPDEVGKLQRPYSLVMSDSDPAIMYAPDLSQYAMNEFLGMGDEEHNNRLRQKKAEEHKKNERPHNSKMELWGIWNVWKRHIDAQILKQQKEKAAKAAKK